MQTKAIIIGGGIGGLTAAIALQRVGIDVTSRRTARGRVRFAAFYKCVESITKA